MRCVLTSKIDGCKSHGHVSLSQRRAENEKASGSQGWSGQRNMPSPTARNVSNIRQGTAELDRLTLLDRALYAEALARFNGKRDRSRVVAAA